MPVTPIKTFGDIKAGTVLIINNLYFRAIRDFSMALYFGEYQDFIENLARNSRPTFEDYVLIDLHRRLEPIVEGDQSVISLEPATLEHWNLDQNTPRMKEVMRLLVVVPEIAHYLNPMQVYRLVENLDTKIKDDYTILNSLTDMKRHNAVSRENLMNYIIFLGQQKLSNTIDDNIKRHGYTFMGVGAGDGVPTFCYTVGLSLKTGFELISVCPMGSAQHKVLLDSYAKLLLAGENITDERCGVLEGKIHKGLLRSKAVEVERKATEDFIRITRNDEFRVYQVIIADQHNRFPDEEGYDNAFTQPLLQPV